MTKRVALISEHASPLGILGGVDSGGQNVYVGQLAKHLATLGYDVDLFTRRDSDRLPEIAEWVSGIRIIHVPAGRPGRGPLAQCRRPPPRPGALCHRTVRPRLGRGLYFCRRQISGCRGNRPG